MIELPKILWKPVAMGSSRNFVRFLAVPSMTDHSVSFEKGYRLENKDAHSELISTLCGFGFDLPTLLLLTM